MQPYPPPSPRSSQGPVIAVVAAVALLIAALFVAGVFTLINRGDEKKPVAAPAVEVTVSPTESPTPSPSPSPTPSPTPSIDPLHDPCVVGVWTETSHQSDVTIYGTKVRLSSKGTTQQFKPDGSLVLQPSGSSTGAANGRQYEVITTGTFTYNWQTDKGMLLYSNATGAGTTTWKVNGTVRDTQPNRPETTPERYTCNGTDLRQYGDTYSIELTRTG